MSSVGDGHDLALNAAGSLARRQAIASRERAPLRTTLARVFGVHSEERAWRIGADGEEAVARRLRKLPDTWRVLHAVPVGTRGSDIDHVVIGPGGVFTLNTKNHSGTHVWVGERAFLVNGHRTDYFRNSLHEATRASTLLSEACGFRVGVHPVIVVISRDLTIKACPKNVDVVSHREIDRRLARRRPRLAPEAVASIFEHARRATTWHG